MAKRAKRAAVRRVASQSNAPVPRTTRTTCARKTTISPIDTTDQRMMCRALVQRMRVNSSRFSSADASESAGNAATAYEDPMSASGTASRFEAKVKTETAPVPILEAMDVSMSAVTEPIPSASDRGTESLITDTMVCILGRQRRGRTPASITTGIFTIRYATAPIMTPMPIPGSPQIG